jgi:hypothetical protein
MNIKTFRLEDIELAERAMYYSHGYQRSFRLMPTPRNGRRTIIRLDPETKQEIKTNIHDFLTRLPNQETYAENVFEDSENFYSDPNRYQVYRFRIPWPNKEDLLSVHFRTKSEDKETEDYLAAFEEAIILRSSVRSKFLDPLIEADFPTEYKRFLEKIPELAKQEIKDLEGIPGEEYKRDHLRYYGLMLMNCLGIMKLSGYTPKRALEIAEKTKIGSPFILDSVRRCFN